METPPTDDPRREVRLLPDGLLARMRADPVHAPEHLTLAAVERLGPEARDWVIAMRRRHPAATDENLARHARTRFVRLARYSGATAGVLGLPGAIVDTGVLAWTQARMVLHLAAVYGHDPADRERAAELLVLQQVHTVIATAETALDVAARRAAPADLLRHTSGSSLAVARALAGMVTGHVARRALLKVVPLASVPLGAMANAGSTKRLADRTIAYYRDRRELPPA
jgi:uncharacterized protein (DUF697 family)